MGCCEDTTAFTETGSSICANIPQKICKSTNRKLHNLPCCDITDSSCNSDLKSPKCMVVGKPCCLGVEGKCVIETQDYCADKHGIFHEDKASCSEVNCQEESCGLMPF